MHMYNFYIKRVEDLPKDLRTKSPGHNFSLIESKRWRQYFPLYAIKRLKGESKVRAISK